MRARLSVFARFYGLSACLHVCMSARLHVCMTACLHVLSVFARLYELSPCLHVCMSARLHVCVTARLHVCMSACERVWIDTSPNGGVEQLRDPTDGVGEFRDSPKPYAKPLRP